MTLTRSRASRAVNHGYAAPVLHGEVILLRRRDLHVEEDAAARRAVQRQRRPRVITVSEQMIVGLTVEPKVLALVQECFLWRFPHLERVQGVINGVSRDHVLWDPRDPSS